MSTKLDVHAAEDWIISYLRKNLEASVTNAPFHDEFHAKFGGTRQEYLYGASPVPAAQRLLSKMHKRGILERTRVGLPNWKPGFPKWVYSYRLTAHYRPPQDKVSLTYSFWLGNTRSTGGFKSLRRKGFHKRYKTRLWKIFATVCSRRISPRDKR